MGSKYRVKTDFSEVYKYVRRVLRRSTNFSSVFKAAMRDLERQNARHFESNGSGKWAPLDSEYAAWKTKNYGARGVLVRSGTLKRSLTMSNARGAVRDVGRSSATWGTTVKYAHFHQTGTEDMAQRTFIFTPNRLAEGAALDAVEYLAYGNSPVGAMKRATNIGRR